MAQFITAHAAALLILGKACIAGAVVFGTLAFVLWRQARAERLRAPPHDGGDEGAEWAGENRFHSEVK